MSLSDEQINSESWRLSTKRQYENWTGCEYHVVEGIQDFARVIESEVAAPLLERIADLERELEAVRKDAGWRDIETAPKDGTAILLAYKLWPQFPSGPYGEVAQWDDFYCGWAGALPETQSDAAFSHWMPLPPPPDAAKEKP